MSDYREKRKKFVDFVKESLLGEELQDDLLIEPNPFNRYTIGILRPIGQEEDEIELSDMQLSDEENTEKTYRYQPPSSMGFSFYVDNTLEYIRISYKCSLFEYLGKEDQTSGKDLRVKWKKSILEEEGLNDNSTNGIQINTSSSHNIYDGRGKIDINIRPHENGKIVTVSLSNTSGSTHLSKKMLDVVGNREYIEEAELSLYEVELQCHFSKAALFNYPRISKELLTKEEKELELRYKDQNIYAIGHGVAVDWRDDKNNEINIFSDFMPTVEVPQVTADVAGKNSKVLSFEVLANLESDDSVFSLLEDFIDSYLDWIENNQEEIKKSEKDDEQDTATRIIDRQYTAVRRMRKSLALLERSEKAQKAFSLANQAMLMQMQLNGKNPKTPYCWRPFQLAFVLTVLESCVDDDSDYRDIVDLIWFPTGGGKTEAYLGVMAFIFVLRRLEKTDTGGGTVAIMRYTLRLLTSQQFERACKVISALELIRQKTPELGSEPYSIGLWVGGASSPNTFKQALEQWKKQKYSKFVLCHCPWCSHPFDENNYKAKDGDFYFSCTNPNCDFGHQTNNRLPFNVVDEALYQHPPTLLIATVDKFARLAWEERSNAFFGGGTNVPPELIIQDELHLISDALGSIVGLHEVGLETIFNSYNVYPKFIASTATIRQADKQVKLLFGKEMMVFPPVGLRNNDSYFAKEVQLNEKPGRLYVGYMAFGRKRTDCVSDLAGVLLAAPQTKLYEHEDIRDAWWTTMYYHGSLKGVGNTNSNFQLDVLTVQKRMVINYFHRVVKKLDEAYWNVLEKEIENPGFMDGYCIHPLIMNNTELKKLYQQCFPIRPINLKNLTGTQTAELNAEVFENLRADFTQKDKVIDAVLATNMVSVGLDEPRLASMVVNGQPLTTAEYIQASSRVGRGKVPGIVFVNYYKTQARSLSHYENFRSYHDAFYRYVEPSSLTPFTKQTLKRALHSSFVIAIRHAKNGLLNNNEAKDLIDKHETVQSVLTLFKKRIKRSLNTNLNNASEQFIEIEQYLDELVVAWSYEVKNTLNLRYTRVDKGTEPLLFPFGEDSSSGLWATLNSMRTVEKTALLEVDCGGQQHSKKCYTDVRFSHLTGNSGPDSLARDSNDWLVRVSDTSQWNSRKLMELHAVKRVKVYFKVPDKRLLFPPEAEITSEVPQHPPQISGVPIPAKRFPNWMKCNKCNHITFMPWKNIIGEIDCQVCKKGRLQQLPWCAISACGQLQDVRWHYLCHRKGNTECKKDHTHPPYLKVISNNNGKIIIECDKKQGGCGSRSEPIAHTIFSKNNIDYPLCIIKKE